MRERFGDWGAELSNEDFACALAAAGLIGPEADPRWPAERLAEEIWRRAGRWPWVLTRAARRFDPETLARAWRLLVKQRVPFEIFLSARLPGIEPSWLSAQLALAGARARFIDLDDDSFLRKPSGAYSLEVPEEQPTRSLGRGRERQEREEEKAEEGPRYLQARVQLLQQEYWVYVRIGLPDDLWAALEKPFPSLSDTETHQLTVIFWEPTVSPEPQIGHLLLPPRGNSEEALFSFRSAEGPGPVAARITVLHNNRVLQTGLLRWREGRWTFSLDATPRTRLEGLSARSEFDAALVLNHDDEGTARATAAMGDTVVPLKLDDGPVRNLTDFLNTQISAIALSPERYGSLDSPGTAELLRSLAIMGAAVHDSLRANQRLGQLANARRIHITSAKAESFFPVELLYCHRPPSLRATLCPHAAAALESGDCTAECPADKKHTVCPLGFWGLSRVIERHAHEPEDGEPKPGDFQLRSEPVRKQNTLPISGNALLAASNKAREKDADAVTRLLQRLQQRGPAALVDTWEEWEQHVASDSPRLLVLLPHHERQGGFDVLEIGDGEQLPSASIWDDHVRRVPDGPSPIVLLIGCATNLTRVSFDNPAGRFHDRGAAVVVSTIATILGRHASPATAMLVELIDEMAAEGTRTLGDVMLRLRQKLVAKQTPMALGLTAYGDADWILTRQADALHRNAPRPLR